MHKWICPLCDECVSAAFEHNLGLLVKEHRQVCTRQSKQAPRATCSSTGWLTASDREFLANLAIRW
jgi:hypothetical protein